MDGQPEIMTEIEITKPDTDFRDYAIMDEICWRVMFKFLFNLLKNAALVFLVCVALYMVFPRQSLQVYHYFGNMAIPLAVLLAVILAIITTNSKNTIGR
jgi:hypothetical protein